MMRAVAILLGALLAVSAVSGARINNFNFPAPAPGPASKAAADLLFTVTASRAVFTAPDSLALEGLDVRALAFNTRTRATATYTLGTFANTTSGEPLAATWAGQPDAVMYASRNGSKATALLQLSQPAYNASTGRLTFAVRLLPAEAQQLSLDGGATARVADDAANGIASPVLTQAPVGAQLTSAALFIDAAAMQVSGAATTKDGWGWGNSGWNSGWNSGGNSWGNGGNGGYDQSYQQPYQQQSSPTNINNNNVVQNQGWNSPTNINNNNVVGNNGNGQTNLNNNNAGGNGNGGTNINNNNVGK